MTRAAALLAAVLAAVIALPLAAQTQQAKAADVITAKLTITVEPLGDTDSGVVSRVTFRFTGSADVPPETPLAIQGSILQGGSVVKNFRFPLAPNQQSILAAVQTLPLGTVDIEARLLIPLETEAPLIVTKTSTTVTVAKTNKPFVAGENATADAIAAEGVVPEIAGAVKILTPRRDVAPNLFIVEVDVQPPVKRVEFWVEGKKILARNAPPYRAELDLGKLPKRVEVRAVGYDAQGRYVDADAFIVNERETPLEVKITRTVTPDNISHFKLSIQNPKNSELKTVALFAGKTKLHEWTQPPYALNVNNDKLKNIDFVRASVIDDANYEASDLLYLNGERYTETIDVNLVELPVTVLDAAGLPISTLKQENFRVFENGKPQKITAFNYASNLPLSLGVLVDHSGSMEKRMAPTKAAAAEFFRSIMKPGDRAFIGGFSFDATKLAPFVTDIAALAQQVENVPAAGGGTSLYDAIVTGLYRFRSLQGRKALVILSDGEDTTSRLGYDEMLTYVRASRVPLYFIGIGLGIGDISGTSKMKAMAAETGGVAYFIKDVKQLKETYDQLEKDLRSQYLVSYYTESDKKDTKYRTVEVKVDRADAKVRTIRGFIP